MNEVHCISCGYSLAGLPRESLCPECAFPVARSLDASHLLRTADPRWLAGVASGFRWLRLAMMSWLIAVIILLPGMALTLFVGTFVGSGPMWYELVMTLIGLLCFSAGVIGLLLGSAGLWKITAPTHGPQAPRARHRLPLRWIGVPFLVLPIIALAAGPMWRLSQLPDAGIYAVRAAFQIAGIAGIYFLAKVLEHFERSTPDSRPNLSRRTRNVRHNLAGLVFLFAIGWVVNFTSAGMGASMPLGFAPFLFIFAFMGFDDAFKSLRDAIAVESREARANGPG